MTDGERRLWSELKQFRNWYGMHVRRQAPIGVYVVDFVIRRLVIEVDGEHHFTSDGLRKDAHRHAGLDGLGYRILRLSTGDLSQSFDGCIEEILDVLALKDQPPPRTPPLKGEGDDAAFAPDTSADYPDMTRATPSPLRGGVRGGGDVLSMAARD